MEERKYKEENIEGSSSAIIARGAKKCRVYVPGPALNRLVNRGALYVGLRDVYKLSAALKIGSKAK